MRRRTETLGAGSGKRRRLKRWVYAVAPLAFLTLGAFTLERGQSVLKKLAFFLDPLYSHAMSYEAAAGTKEDTGNQVPDPDQVQDSSWSSGDRSLDVNLSGSVEVIYGDGYMEETEPEGGLVGLEGNRVKLDKLKKSKDYKYLLQNFYVVDNSTYVSSDLFPVEDLMGMDLSFLKDASKPQILIHHTHASERFIDSRNGKQEDTVVGMGLELARLLSEQYGFQVIHDKTAYDMTSGKLDRSTAYNYAKDGTESILEEYPSIQVIIDLHRDGGKKRVTTIDGKETAQIMFFNGLSRNMNGPITYLYNPYLEENLALSLQLKMAAMERYDDYAKPTYLKGYEYNLSMLPRSLLIEVGTDQNTVEESINAMAPLAEILNQVMQKPLNGSST